MKTFLDPAARSQSHCAGLRNPEHLFVAIAQISFSEKVHFSLDWSEQFSQSTHPNNTHKTTEAPASLSAFSRGCDMERAGKIWFMHELLCLLSKRRLFPCRWVELPKNAPWWIASLIPSLHILQDSGQMTATQDQSHLLLGNCTECGSIIYRFAARGNFALDCVQMDLFPRFWRGLVKIKM